ncbi:hypothetical protein ABZT03_04440 [Streptomyces sp. NPDC005574]|uniref:hypothetical protein n=1 Tax=Streptomyces sp. NPDC005574 TaxID=3156891 RepID=UPI0033A31F73
MTDLSTEPVAVEAAPITPPPPPDTPPAVAKHVPDVDHTPGGWPIVPLALSGANSTVGAVAAASLAGGPIAAAIAATGMVVLGTVAAARSRKPDPRREARRSAARTAGRSAARKMGQHGSGAGTRRSSGGRSAGSRSVGSGGRSGKVPGQHRRTGGSATRHGSTTTGGNTLRKSPHGPAKHQLGSGKGAASRVGQVKALRAARKDTAGSRGGQRAQTTNARRAVADARRNAKSVAGNNRAVKRSGLGGRLLGGAARKVRAVRDAAIAKQRTKRDAKAGNTVAAQRAQVRKAPARKAARQALRRSAARFQGRRLLAGLLALPVGLLGCLSTWIGRKFGIPALIHPGRRLYRRMVQTAGEQRAARDETAHDKQREQEATADAEAAKDGTEGIADGVQRPAATVPTSTNTPAIEGEHVSINTGFNFEDHAMEMAAAANTYEPDGCMEILAMVEGLPGALTFVATVMKFLAERSDSEFPLEKQVADGFNDIYAALMNAVSIAEDMGPTFRQVHAQDIARHEDPRNGTEAEKGWNV